MTSNFQPLLCKRNSNFIYAGSSIFGTLANWIHHFEYQHNCLNHWNLRLLFWIHFGFMFVIHRNLQIMVLIVADLNFDSCSSNLQVFCYFECYSLYCCNSLNLKSILPIPNCACHSVFIFVAKSVSGYFEFISKSNLCRLPMIAE